MRVWGRISRRTYQYIYAEKDARVFNLDNKKIIFALFSSVQRVFTINRATHQESEWHNSINVFQYARA